jgi:hypothetical protein
MSSARRTDVIFKSFIGHLNFTPYDLYDEIDQFAFHIIIELSDIIYRDFGSTPVGKLYNRRHDKSLILSPRISETESCQVSYVTSEGNSGYLLMIKSIGYLLMIKYIELIG